MCVRARDRENVGREVQRERKVKRECERKGTSSSAVSDFDIRGEALECQLLEAVTQQAFFNAWCDCAVI